MRLTRTALSAVLGGITAVVLAAGCGQSPQAGGAVLSASGPAFGVQQARALHYLIIPREEGDRKVVADVTLYSDGRIVVTAKLEGGVDNPRVWVDLRFTNQAQRDLWTNTWRERFCEEAPCAPRTATWTFKTSPGIASRISNVWMKVDILD